jgi:hypothetical protein
VELGGQARWTPIRRLAVRLDLEGLAPLARPDFAVISTAGAVVGVVSHPDPVWGRLGIGLEIVFF